MYHNPVLLAECMDGLAIRPNGTYVDVTFGGGGHSSKILSLLGNRGKLIGFDKDKDALANDIKDGRFKLVHSDFRFISNHLEYLNAIPVDGLLADLGVSSHQFDEGERGFSIRNEGNLDMRMNRSQSLSAAEILNNASKAKLIQILKEYGEVPNYVKLAESIIAYRETTKFVKTGDLVTVASRHCSERDRNQYLAQVFQSFRIEVNNELESLNELLNQMASVIKPGGRLAIISYHSLEDRTVKNYMRSGNASGETYKDFFGKSRSPFKQIQSKPFTPSAEELKSNNRSRSAKLRVAERTTFN